jgi:AcrR family transcriptional regulator
LETPDAPLNSLHDRVVDTGERLFRRNGYSPVTMDHIAQDLGISKKTLYSVCKSKENILSDIIDKVLKAIAAKIDELFDDTSLRFVERAARWFVFLRFIHDKVTPGSLMRDIQKNAPQAWGHIRMHVKERTERIARFFEQGRVSGEFRYDLNPVLCARVYSNCSTRILDEDVLAGLHLTRKTAFETFGQLFYTGMFSACAREALDEAKNRQAIQADIALEHDPQHISKRILHASRVYFFTYGYSKVRIDEIAAEIGISKKTLYNHFDSKEALLREVLHDFASELTEKTVNVSTQSVVDYVVSLRTFVVTMADRLSEISPQFVRDLSRTTPELRDELLSWRSEKIDRTFAMVLKKGQSIGAIRSDLSAMTMAKVYNVVLDSVFRSDEVSGNVPQPVDVYRTIVNTMFIGTLEDVEHEAFLKANRLAARQSSKLAMMWTKSGFQTRN